MDTQARIIEHLDMVGSGTVNHLSRSLGLTKADIRYQLKTLIRNNQVKQLSESLQNGPGRPAAQFCLNEQPPARLYSSILDSILEMIYPYNYSPVFEQKLADAVVSGLLIGIEDSGSPAVRLSRRIERLSTLGFRIRWEAGPNGPVIHDPKRTYHCCVKESETFKVDSIQLNKAD